MNPLFNNQAFTLLEKSLDASSLRQKTISNNVANVNTPGFKRSEVKFEDELARALSPKGVKLEATHPQHLSLTNNFDRVKPEVITDNQTTMRTDGNNVDIDAEMTTLAINQIYYNALVQRMNGKFGNLRHVISEGRR